MREILYISDIMAKYQGKLARKDIEAVVKKYDSIYRPRIKQGVWNTDLFEKEMLQVMDSELEKLLTT